jgi:hypothetical protein
MENKNKIYNVLNNMIGNHYYSIVLDKTWNEPYNSTSEKIAYFKSTAKPNDIEKYVVIRFEETNSDLYGVTFNIVCNNITTDTAQLFTINKKIYFGVDSDTIIRNMFGSSSDICVSLTILCDIFDNFDLVNINEDI